MKKLIKKSCDVAVIGGGPGGLPAAIIAARMGKKVILVERNSFLGGTATSGLGILGYIDRKGNKSLGGLAQEFIDRLQLVGGAIGHYRCPVHNSITPISPEWIKIIAVEMCEEAGVDILFNQELMDVNVDNGRVCSVTIFGKCTQTVIEAKTFVDATGDGDLAYMSGAKYISGQDGTGIMQPSTLMFTIHNFDLDKFLDFTKTSPEDYGIKEDYAEGYDPDFFKKTPGHCFVGLTKIIREAKENGDFIIPRNQLVYITTPNEHMLAINTSRIINIDASDPYQLSEGLILGYKQIRCLMRFFNKYVPGFEKAELVHISPTLGVRETRHFVGTYRLTRENMYSKETKENAIAQSAYNIDIHSGTQDHIDLSPITEPFGIPYGCLVPERVNGLLLSGRAISLDTDTFASARVMGPCIAVGEAVGVASVLSINGQIEPREVPVHEIQKILRANGNIF